jgi:hypothetical protein
MKSSAENVSAVSRATDLGLTDEELVDLYYQLLAYAGPTPDVAEFAPFQKWVRVAGDGIRLLHPEASKQDVHDVIVWFADWCRQAAAMQRTIEQRKNRSMFFTVALALAKGEGK